MLARLKGMNPTASAPTAAPDNTKKADVPAAAAANGGVAVAAPPQPAAAPAASARASAPAPVAAAPAPPPPAATPAPAAPAASATPQLCAFCKSPRKGEEEYCDNCGCVFSAASASGGAGSASSLIKGRYQLAEMLRDFEGVARFKAIDQGAGNAPVVVVRQAAAEAAQPVDGAPDVELAPSFDGAAAAEVEVTEASGPAWPSLAWEAALLEKAKHSALPRILDQFTEDGFDYLIEELPVGQTIGLVWDDPDIKTSEKWGWLKQVAEGLVELHKQKTILEGIRPDLVTIQDNGKGAMINDLTDLLPLPLPPNAPVRGTLYSAPEVVAVRSTTDARSDLYSMGAMIYSLIMGTDLNEKDFDKASGLVKNFIARNPDVHPHIGRIVSKTFCRDPQLRWPSDEWGKKDPTGGTELVNALDVARKLVPNCRLEIASWTTTGIVRTGNEDAFTLLHAVESRQEDITEYALLLLADGMGGYEAGELAAALCLNTLRKTLTSKPMFAAVSGQPHPKPEEFNADACKKIIYDALKEANDVVHTAPTKGIGRRGMGCTAEVIYVDGQNVVVGHVGDSRTYHLHEGRLKQLTRDHTLVNRLVELGQISEAEAENHPRKNELQQAIGGRRDVEPAVYTATLKPGDWLLVCSDGLTGHIKNDEIQEMFQLEANSSELAARRLVNFANLRGATDNSTVIVVRVT